MDNNLPRLEVLVNGSMVRLSDLIPLPRPFPFPPIFLTRRSLTWPFFRFLFTQAAEGEHASSQFICRSITTWTIFLRFLIVLPSPMDSYLADLSRPVAKALSEKVKTLQSGLELFINAEDLNDLYQGERTDMETTLLCLIALRGVLAGFCPDESCSNMRKSIRSQASWVSCEARDLGNCVESEEGEGSMMACSGVSSFFVSRSCSPCDLNRPWT